MADSMLSANGAENGFWGSVIGGIGQGIGKVASDVLPTWAAGQLGVGNNDPLSAISNPINTNMGDTSGRNTLWDDNQITEAGFFQGLEPKTALTIGLVIVGAFMLFKLT